MKNSTRQTITFLIIVLGLAACTPASTPPVDTGQEEQPPTLTLFATETPIPTKTLTPTKTPIPPTPTFPAPENAELPDSAVRSVNEQGQEVILDQPGGEVLWMLVETDSGERTWQENLSPEEKMAVSVAEADTAEAKRQAAVEFANYLNEEVVLDASQVRIPLEKEVFGGEWAGWNNAAQEWQVGYESDSFEPMVVPAFTDEQGKETFVLKEGEVVVEPFTIADLGQFSLADLYFMQQRNGQDLNEWSFEQMLAAQGLSDRARGFIEAAQDNHFALPVILEEGYSRDGTVDNPRSRLYVVPRKYPEITKLHHIGTAKILMPVYDPETQQVLFGLRVNLGIKELGGIYAFIFNKSQMRFDWAFSSDVTMFGHNFGKNVDTHTPAILIQGDDSEAASQNASVDFIMDRSEGVGDATDLKQLRELMNNGASIVEILEILEEMRIIVLYQDKLIYHEQN